MVTRRGLFRLMGGAAATIAEPALVRRFFFPPIGGWSSQLAAPRNAMQQSLVAYYNKSFIVQLQKNVAITRVVDLKGMPARNLESRSFMYIPLGSCATAKEAETCEEKAAMLSLTEGRPHG